MNKFNAIVLDCETISHTNNIIYDIAWVCVSKNKIVETHSYLVKENLEESLGGSFSQNKMGQTLYQVIQGGTEVLPFAEIVDRLLASFEETQYIYAYNAMFDRGKISETCDAFDMETERLLFEQPETMDKWRDLWSWAANTVLYKKSFLEFTDAHEFKTPTGLDSTTAETCIRFLRDTPEYVEKHLALDDVLDEYEIYLTIKQEVKKESVQLLPRTEKGDFATSPPYVLKRLRKALSS